VDLSHIQDFLLALPEVRRTAVRHIHLEEWHRMWRFRPRAWVPSKESRYLYLAQLPLAYGCGEHMKKGMAERVGNGHRP
jgi:hypothetical protein